MNAKTKALIFIGVKHAGTYDPDICLAMVEEQMTVKEAIDANDFLKWVHENKKAFGPANLDRVYSDYKQSK